MSLTMEQLRNGIKCWQVTSWPKDFHNKFYREDLQDVCKNGIFNEEWWGGFIKVLRSWRATRPYSTVSLTDNAKKLFSALRDTWEKLIIPHLNEDIAGLEWDQVREFPLVVEKIKPTKSPVFTAKFCHFLAPRIFPVVDNAAMGNPFPTYEKYYNSAKEEWLSTNVVIQNEMVSLLTEKVCAVSAPLFSEYPMKCKLIELCMIGRYKAGEGISVLNIKKF